MDLETVKELEMLVVPAVERGEEPEYYKRLFQEIKQDIELESEIYKCERCGLRDSRTNVVPGHGKFNTNLMFVGEGPGKDEDEQGIPFVGKAGQLLDRIIDKAKWKREDIFITNIVKCRTPDNREPKKEESAQCFYWLEKQIERVNPTVIVCWGSVSSKKLIHPDFKITKENGQLFEDENGRKLVGLYHPAFVLRKQGEEQVEVKKEVWEGIKKVKEALGEDIPQD